MNRYPIPQADVSTVSIKTNRDTPLDGAANPVDISSLPIPEVVKESEERNIVGDAYREAEELLKTRDKDMPHPAAAKKYFLEKIGQYNALYNGTKTISSVIKKLMAIENYFRDPSITSVKWININDVVIYGGLNTGVKFAVFLEYFVLPSEKRPKTSPPYYELLMKQIAPFLDKLDVEHHVGTPTIAFAQEARATELPPPISDEESSEKAADFLTRTSDAYRHSAPNARAIMNFAYLGAYDIKSQQGF